ncbi:MAG: hypothetical protein A2589_03055 [Candidatus Vogelbacteria bacterium RIFOXYD1_FULL_46_19]|uniref:Nucleoside 2-deoxyribosyltransferase n=1 Tax=Candidatus Vogelbacteria bacterium RIFOXYD1_FULL_46_19 TaxID=1802439 RepID=A0A1G2QHE8_9BACT|nr:MAG: hypothetical protein A2589_03055 [Candidatus Vogelbacteria bacterium RIFOXYD1_FULL_46_19]
MRKSAILYLAGGLFNAGERIHNLYLEVALGVLGHAIVLPQREALRFQNPQTCLFDTGAISRDCRRAAENPNSILVGCVDGPDVDSGTAVEYAYAMAKTGRAIIYRTDFRTSLEHEVGVNAMLRGLGTEFIYLPCFITELEEIELYYRHLARKIDEAAQRILAVERVD